MNDHESHAWIDGDYHRCGACGAEKGTDEAHIMCSLVLPFVIAELEACAKIAREKSKVEIGKRPDAYAAARYIEESILARIPRCNKKLDCGGKCSLLPIHDGECKCSGDTGDGCPA